MLSTNRPAHRKPLPLPTSHFIYSATDELALDCKRLETMQLTSRAAHRQTYYSLYWVIAGNCTVGIDFVEYPLGPLTLTLLQPGQIFSPHVSAPLHGLAVYFPHEFLRLESLGTANPFPILTGAEPHVLAPLAVGSAHAAHLHLLMSTLADEFVQLSLSMQALVACDSLQF